VMNWRTHRRQKEAGFRHRRWRPNNLCNAIAACKRQKYIRVPAVGLATLAKCRPAFRLKSSFNLSTSCSPRIHRSLSIPLPHAVTSVNLVTSLNL
jgi:hypothetical protein